MNQEVMVQLMPGFLRQPINDSLTIDISIFPFLLPFLKINKNIFFKKCGKLIYLLRPEYLIEISWGNAVVFQAEKHV